MTTTTPIDVIENLGLHTRLTNDLLWLGITTVTALRARDLRGMYGIGPVGVRDIEDALARYDRQAGEGLVIHCACGEQRVAGRGCLACAVFEAVRTATREEKLPAAEFSRLLARAGRVHGPALLSGAWSRRVITAATLAAEIGEVWSAAEYPEQTLGRPRWRELFGAAGYTAGGSTAAPPASPVTLWRGAPAARKRGMSWTASRSVAERFASGELYGREPGEVWQARVPPRALLAHCGGRSEAEYVVDARHLQIARADPAPPLAELAIRGSEHAP